MILYWWLPSAVSFWGHLGITAIGLIVGSLLVALLTKPRQLKKYATYRTDMYGRRYKVGEHENLEFGPRGWATLLMTVGLLLHWPGFVTLTMISVTVYGYTHLTRGVYSLTDRAKSAPRRKRELRKKAEQDTNQWLSDRLEQVERAWEALTKDGKQ